MKSYKYLAMCFALSLTFAVASCNNAENKGGKDAAKTTADSTVNAHNKTLVADDAVSAQDTTTALTASGSSAVAPASASSGIVGLDINFVKRAMTEDGFLTRANSQQAIRQFRILANIAGTPEVWTTFDEDTYKNLSSFVVVMSTVGMSEYPADAGADFPFTAAQLAEIRSIAEAGMKGAQKAY